jgi:site-specific recombinase XerD
VADEGCSTNKGLDTRTLQAYLGHRSINSTTRYAALAPALSQREVFFRCGAPVIAP